jgi:hypothetical protein
LLQLPDEADTLTLTQALTVIREACIRSHIIEPSETLRIFIGIDEYQAIPNSSSGLQCAQSTASENPVSGLQRLVDCILDTAMSCSNNVHIYPLFAGTHWGKMSSLSVYSNADTDASVCSIYLPLTLKTWFHHSFHTHFRKHLYFLGGLPRPIYEYARAVEALAFAVRSIENMDTAFYHVWEKRYTRQYSQVPLHSLVRLVAYALSGLVVNEADQSGIDIGGVNYSWGALRDIGLCSLNSAGGETSVYIPYGVLHICWN